MLQVKGDDSIITYLCNNKGQFQEITSFRKPFGCYFLTHTAINFELCYGSVDPALWESSQCTRNSEDHIRKTINCQNITHILLI